MVVALSIITWIALNRYPTIYEISCATKKNGGFSGYSAANSETRASFSVFIYKTIILLTRVENPRMLTSYLCACVCISVYLSGVF